jgi:peptidoglycan/xylan/chitin deacetylase (PgdA/CDA1 family)
MTDLKTLAGRMTLGAAHWSGSSALARLGTRPFGAIFTLHHVSPCPVANFPPNGHLNIHPDFLRQVIQHLKGKGCDIVDLDEAVSRIVERRRDRFFAAFTLDDGYLDNADHAAPVFRSEAVPYTIFVSPGLSEGKVLPWWEVAEAVVAESDRVLLPWLSGRAVEIASTSAKKRAFDVISIYLTTVCAEGEVAATTRRLAEVNGRSAPAERSRVMGWDKLAQMARDPLASIGAHSMTHPRLARLSADEAYDEIARSRGVIAERLGTPPRYFAYPYGSTAACGQREFEMAKRAGFRASFTTQLHALTAARTRHLQALPRLSLNGYYQDVRHVDVLVSGLPGLWKEAR